MTKRPLAAFALTTALVLPALAVSARAETPVQVVTSFSILADMTQRVGGAHVAVTSLVGRGADAHQYEPVPGDVVAVTAADLVVMNGLGFEGFMERLIEASGTEARIAVVTEGVQVIETDQDGHGHGHDDHAHGDHGHDHAHDDHGHDHAHDDHGHDHAHGDHAHDDHGHGDHDHGPIDPHAWQSLDAAKGYVANIAAALCATAPEACADFEANAAAYTAEMAALEAELEAAFEAIPAESRVVITGHDAFAYLARDFGLTMLAPQGLSTDAEASAADVAGIIDRIRDTGAHAMFVESNADPRLLARIAEETGLTVSQVRLYADALSAEDGPAPTYLDLMRHNAGAIAQALSGS